MPSVKPALRFFLHNSILRKVFCRLFFPLFGLIIFLAVLFKQASDRTIFEENSKTVQLSEEEKSELAYSSKEPSFAPLGEDISKLAVPPQTYDEWCQARDYVDLSKDPVFKNFENWMDQYKSFHDPRKVAQFMDKGLKLAKHRAQILQQIIRGDPRRALELAMDKMSPVSSLPEPFSEYTEKWVNEFADIEAIHSCYDLNHPKGLIKRWATFDNGDRVRVWVYGHRSKLATARGVAVWGIQLGEDIAISEQPYRIVKDKAGNETFVRIGSQEISFVNDLEKNLLVQDLKLAEASNLSGRRAFSYPMIAGSSGNTEYYRRKYTLVETLATWNEANSTARDMGGRLVSIETEAEQMFIANMLEEAAIIGFNESNTSLLKYAWLGASDSESEWGFSWDDNEDNYTLGLLGASEGSWRWLYEATPVEDGYQNWAAGTAPLNNTFPNQDYASMDWSSDQNYWVDVNASHRLPFVVEFDNISEPVPIQTPINGIRKILVIPARFQDEGEGYEPLSNQDLTDSFQNIREFFLRNSDQSLEILPVISPTVTLPLDKWALVQTNPLATADGVEVLTGGPGYKEIDLDPNDPYKYLLIDYDGEELGGLLDGHALSAAGEMSDEFEFGGASFNGGTGFTANFPLVNTAFTAPPKVSVYGGDVNPETGLKHPDFKPVQAYATLNNLGQVTAITITDPGQFYYIGSPSPISIFLNNEDFTASIDLTIESTCLSYVILSTWGDGLYGGLGFVGAAGSYVTAGAIGSGGVTAHELGHNFNQHHSNTYLSLSEKPNSDEVVKFEYGNPFSVMGDYNKSIATGGDLTIIGKVSSKLGGGDNFGYSLGKTAGVDVAWLEDITDVNSSPFRMETSSKHSQNTFRIYRHDYGHIPTSLYEGFSFEVELPAEIRKDLNKSFPNQDLLDVHFVGTGEGATGVLDLGDNQLHIITGGLGYAVEPQAVVMDDQNRSVLPLDASWVKVRNGTEYLDVAKFRNLSDNAPRGLRGIKVKASDFGSRSLNSVLPFNAYWLSYRRSASENGLTILLGSEALTNALSPALDDALLDMTPHTPSDFNDAFLLPGFTYSDYDSDVHVTTVSKGGISPMEYLDVVVSVGTVEAGQAAAPVYDLAVSNRFPEIGEFVSITAQLTEGNLSKDFAFSWFTNEVPETKTQFLNQSTLTKSFNEKGEYVIRVMVSDMKGGVASSNLVIKVGDYENSTQSSISGVVRSKNGMIQGARVVAAKAPVTSHYVNAYGSESGLFLPSGIEESLKYAINGNVDGHLVMRRGEVHRFYFEQSISGYPLTFWNEPEGYAPQIRMKMLSTPRIDEMGTNYRTVPEVELVEVSAFANYIDPVVGTIEDFQKEGLTAGNYIIQRPYLKAIMEESSLHSVAIRPPLADPDTGNFIRYGGSGLSRANGPHLSIKRLSFWENYSEQNATLVAYVDGVNTIAPVNGSDFLSPNWLPRPNDSNVPDLVVWGTSSIGCFEVTVPKTNYKPISNFQGRVSSQGDKRVISISDQGFNWEPNGTMAVLHYPEEPIAYWTFDRHETLFDDSNESRFQPSPAWLRNIKRKLTHHYAFEEEDGTYVFDKIADNNISMGADFNMSDESRWAWGAKGRSLELNGTNGISFPGIIHQDSNFTFSAWLKPNDDFTLTIGTKELGYAYSTGVLTFNNDTGLTLTRLSENSQWMHFGFVQYDNTRAHIYLDGQRIYVSPALNIGTPDIVLSNYDGLVDEVQYFETMFSESVIKELAGRVFLDLSGNKLHAVPIGSDLPLSSPNTDTGISSDRPEWNDGSRPQASPNGLGDSFAGENHGRSLKWNEDSQMRVDLRNHIPNLGSLNIGTLSFWIKTDGLDSNDESVEQTIFSASNSEDNATFFRIMLKNTGVLQLHAINQGIEVAKFYTPSPEGKIASGNPGQSIWRHVALVVDETQSFFWVDGERIPAIPYSNGAGNARAFFSDVENLNNMSIGRHITADGVDYFQGNIDDVYLYGRALGQDEINYLYDLRAGRESLPRLEAVVDSIGTIDVKSGGAGYRELPDVQFSLGRDANSTNDLAEYNASTIPSHGTLEYDSINLKIMSYHHGSGNTPTNEWRVVRNKVGGNIIETASNANAWREYQRPYGEPIFNQTKVEHLVWMKDLQRDANLTLPDGRNVLRKYVEYVVPGNSGYLASPNSHLPDQNFCIPGGLFGYSAKPRLNIDGNATGYILYFADLQDSPDIVNAGGGLQRNNFDPASVFRVAGSGYTSTKGEYTAKENFFGDLEIDNVVTTPKENNDLNQLESTINFGQNYQLYLKDFDHNPTSGEPRDFIVDINKTVSHVSVTDAGQGYSMPVEVKLLGGYPTDVELRNHVEANGNIYEFRRAVVRVDQVDANGSILSFVIEDNGTGYSTNPQVVISGGGGYGADAIATTSGGEISAIEIVFPGRGYFNIDPANTPSAQIAFTEPLENNEENASLEVRLGGSLNLTNSGNTNYPSSDGNNKIGNKDPWIEIWDLNRDETQIDENDSRALAVAKVIDGVIQKVVVVKSGRGYRNPVAIVRGGPPRDTGNYKYTQTDYTKGDVVNSNIIEKKLSENEKRYARYWRCTNIRETLGGRFEPCGHTEWGLYPPEKCPGESFSDTNLTEERTPDVISAWKRAHMSNPHHICESTAFRLRPDDTEYVDLVPDNNNTHTAMQFKTRVCSGTKANFKLLNDPYRWPYQQWESFDAELIPFVENGEITSIQVVNGGQMYLSSEIGIMGTGSGVDIIPVFGEDGNLLSSTDSSGPNYLFDDPQLSNFEKDIIPNPLGAGQGYKERPWARDGMSVNREIGGSTFLDNRPTAGSDIFNYGEVAFYDVVLPDPGSLSVGLTYKDYLGDRVAEVRVLEPGLFKDDRVLENVDLDINFDFPSTSTNEIQVSAQAVLDSTYRLTRVVLDQNASRVKDGLQLGLYNEEPYVYTLARNFTVDDPTSLGFFRLNGQMGYDASSNLNYYDIYVDDDFPNQFYYGFSNPYGNGDFSSSLPAMGGKIIVTEGLPEMNWGRPQTVSDAVNRDNSAYTDQNGHYTLPNLAPGIYNVAVFAEDVNFQESTFRPDANASRVSEVVYVPGFPKLELITDARGVGVSSLLWDENSKAQSVPSRSLPVGEDIRLNINKISTVVADIDLHTQNLLNANVALANNGQDTNLNLIKSRIEEINHLATLWENYEYWLERKRLEGIGAGFRPDETPMLSVVPHPDNLSNAVPEISIEINNDGSLNLQILDTPQSTSFNPQDKFTVVFSSSIQGVNFYEDYHYSLSDQTGWGGSLMSEDSGVHRLAILPSDAAGLNAVEVPVSNLEDGDRRFTFSALANDDQGNLLDVNDTTWELHFDFNATEGNQSRIASLSASSGSSTSILLRSKLRSGRVVGAEIEQRGYGYTDGSAIYLIGPGFGFEASLKTDTVGRVKDIDITSQGTGYDSNSYFVIDDIAGSGATLSPILSNGLGKLKASLVLDSGLVLESEVQFFPSMRSKLTSYEIWLDKVYDTVDLRDRNATWENSDDDLDGLTNLEEFGFNTHPLFDDTDLDGVNDFIETNDTSAYKTNPRSRDTDQDGLTDGQEFLLGSNPLHADSDSDGFDDYTEFTTPGMNVTEVTKLGKLAGIIRKKGDFTGSLYFKLEQGNPSFTEAFFDGNESFSLLDSVSYPYEYIRFNLPFNQHYRITAFVDANENRLFDTNEITDQWQGYLTQSFFDADLTLADKAPTLEFMDNAGSKVQIDRGETLFFQVMAFDYPDQNWTIATAVSPRKIDINGSALAILDLNGSSGTVKIDAPYGEYELTFVATDDSGSLSSTLVRNIEVIDLNPPTITLLTQDEDGNAASYKWAMGEPWDPESLRGRAFLANDYPSGQDLTDDVIISGNVNTAILGTSEISLEVSDVSGKSTTQILMVEVADQTSPEINVQIDIPIVRLLGQKFTLPTSFYTVTDDVDGNLSEDLVVIGSDSLDINSTIPQAITLQVSDSSGNTRTLSVEVIFEKPGFSFNGFAIDGYLIGSEVWFYPTEENLQYLSRSVMTDANGSYQLNFLSSEFQQLDVNNNGVIDLSEGSLSVIGGIDSTTNREFTGALKADPSATVITPLTTVIHAMMDAGQTKEEALIATANAFGYPAEIDVTNYDPFQAAGLGDVDSKKILQSSALVANMMKQAEIFAEISAVSTTTGETSVAVSQELAEMVTSGESLSSSLINETNLKNIFEKSFQRIKPEFVSSSTELDQFASISSASNLAISDSTLLQLEPAKLAGEISNRQIAVEEEVIVELEGVASGQRSLVGLAQEVDLVELVEVSNSMPNFNQYSPIASNFSVFLTDDSFQSGATLTKLNASDPDGDVVVVEIIQGNTDVDGDGSLPFQVNSDLDLIVGDAFDLSQLSVSDFNVTFKVSDAGGKSINIIGSLIKVGENSTLIPVSLFDGQSTGVADWYSSSWLGDFYAKEHKWLYHEKIGWLYLLANTGNGFWCWDSYYEGWWWSSAQVFPYAFLSNNLSGTTGWIYFKLDEPELKVYEFTNQRWR